jgi:hypothetical protein
MSKEVSFPGLIKHQIYIPYINEISLEYHERVELSDTVLWLNRQYTLVQLAGKRDACM